MSSGQGDAKLFARVSLIFLVSLSRAGFVVRLAMKFFPTLERRLGNFSLWRPPQTRKVELVATEHRDCYCVHVTPSQDVQT